MIFSKDFNWILEKTKKHNKNVLFYIWITTWLFYLWKTWYFYLLFFFCLHLSVFFLLIRKNPTIIIKSKSKFSIFWQYARINVIISIMNRKFDKNFVIAWFFLYLFRIITGFAFKYLRFVIAFFDYMYDEYYWAKIYKKKKKLKILYKFFSNVLEKFASNEIIKLKPEFNEIIDFNFIIKKKIFVIIK